VCASIRVGIGYDLHPLVAGRALILGGVEVPHPRGLQGHSDGDALTHAVADALIGAAGRGDIGQWFPDTDQKYEGAHSVSLLADVAATLKREGWLVGNVDATIVAQRPRLSPYLAEMQANLARALQIEASAVNVKATSPELIGALGREHAISAIATALIEREGSHA
jgi:2-C-methyl-D-erythritol 2,4-cyclodiphosphate synthase